ncbi:Transcriptional regulator [Bacteroides ovatus]|jgi:hypothetical protein|uniref:Uncharacterized protein n=1 Tax=Bacteroides ovatus TaxID=28116 RepID=A0A6N2WYY7_BACOV|nr:hypothetical protein HMPREF1070_03752 [Bacteroides ovatus CL03T12C18]CAG9886990.1 Transcriptional regulator [Bacteroides ovatus]MBT0715743.1 hypothetical protein [Bacteroides ovatus CL03T12C18]CAG9911616.1 Transcriptional regulator [Bacteroides ovatus]CAG9916856.1 Transcriptional regulator [Bacteroides ovatus]
MDVLQKEIDEVYATQLIADEILDNGVVEQHQRFIHSLTEINGGCAVISDLSNRKSYIVVHPWAHFLGLTPEEAALSVIDSMGSSSNLVVISFLFQLSSSFLILLKVVDMFAF